MPNSKRQNKSSAVPNLLQEKEKAKLLASSASVAKKCKQTVKEAFKNLASERK